ncbi:hypothetical protein P3339_16945 [Microbulbifer sp. MLAF003]|uniref:hypothetical protein n=1 Tax=Microbulbifer sp. MLAF003 TaxID=3032582 RepID=UPI0024AE594F|nr:hypothetical protein [Microbulbifer sp. MLAF003]WHI50119.1 hypothetical protein P3339_16945 [Microbulbifer sp. MLAF003]
MAKSVLDKFKIRKGKVFEAPLEGAFGRLVTPFEEFIHRQSSSGILLMLSALAALIIANSPWKTRTNTCCICLSALVQGSGSFLFPFITGLMMA